MKSYSTNTKGQSTSSHRVGCTCQVCTGLECAERPRYFAGQLLTDKELTSEQSYTLLKNRLHNRYLHGWGVVCGCTVEPITSGSGWQVRVCPGYAVGPQGDEILVNDCIDVDLSTGAKNAPCAVRWPCPPVGETPPSRDGSTIVYVAVRYAECYSRPVKVHPAGCGCDETGCEYSRVRDSFEIKVLTKLPQSHIDARDDDNAWCVTVQQADVALLRRQHTFPVPPCPPCPGDPWVVLATVAIPGQADPANAAGNANQTLAISYRDRRVLLATQRLQTAMLCLP